MEGAIARWYAALTRKSLADFTMLAQRVASEISPGNRVLEVAPGPGYFAVELAKLGDYRVTGLDISQTFVEIARANAARANVQAEFQRGDASRMPFDGGRFDYVVCRAAFKNFAKPVEALREMCRVLRPGGRGVIIDMRGDATPEALSSHVDAMGLTGFNRIMTKLAFRTTLVKSAYTKGQFEHMLAQTGFSRVEIREAEIGLEVTMVK